jgi:hypothetical protein
LHVSLILFIIPTQTKIPVDFSIASVVASSPYALITCDSNPSWASAFSDNAFVDATTIWTLNQSFFGGMSFIQALCTIWHGPSLSNWDCGLKEGACDVGIPNCGDYTKPSPDVDHPAAGFILNSISNMHDVSGLSSHNDVLFTSTI